MFKNFHMFNVLLPRHELSVSQPTGAGGVELYLHSPNTSLWRGT